MPPLESFRVKLMETNPRQCQDFQIKLKALLIDFLAQLEALKHINIVMPNSLANICLFTHAVESNNNKSFWSLRRPHAWKSYICLFYCFVLDQKRSSKSVIFAAKTLHYQQLPLHEKSLWSIQTISSSSAASFSIFQGPVYCQHSRVVVVVRSMMIGKENRGSAASGQKSAKRAPTPVLNASTSKMNWWEGSGWTRTGPGVKCLQRRCLWSLCHCLNLFWRLVCLLSWCALCGSQCYIAFESFYHADRSSVLLILSDLKLPKCTKCTPLSAWGEIFWICTVHFHAWPTLLLSCFIACH